jgi:integrase
MKLTKAVIDDLAFQGKTPKAKCVYWDEQLPGYGVRVWPTGKKVFLYAYRFHGRQRYLGLGAYGALTPDQARKLALTAAAQVLAGVDPQAERQRARRGETMADLCRHYMAVHSKPHNKTWAKDQERIDAYILPALGTLKVRNVRRGDVSALHHRIGVVLGKRTTANRVVALLSSMFNRARREYGFLDEGAPNPADGIERFPERKRARFVTKDEMPRLAKAIAEEESVYAKAAIWLYLLTGLRKEELLRLRWDRIDEKRGEGAVDLRAGEIYLPDSKAGRPHALPLSGAARYLLEHLPRAGGNPYVLPGAIEGHHLVNISKPWVRIRTKAGLLDVKLHDLRRTVGSWLAQAGYSLALIGHVLNHSNTSTTKIYARFHRDPLQDALNDQARMLAEVSQGLAPAPPPATTVELPAALSADVEANSRASR